VKEFSLSRHIERYRLIDWSVLLPGLAPCNYLSLAVMLHGSDAKVIMRAHTGLVIPFYLHTHVTQVKARPSLFSPNWRMSHYGTVPQDTTHTCSINDTFSIFSMS